MPERMEGRMLVKVSLERHLLDSQEEASLGAIDIPGRRFTPACQQYILEAVSSALSQCMHDRLIRGRITIDIEKSRTL